MDFEEKKKNLEEITKELLLKMGFSKATVTLAVPDNGSDLKKKKKNNNEEINKEIDNDPEILLEINSLESKYLIGKYGVNLNAFEHVLRVLVREKTSEKINFSVDVNQYRQDSRQSIVDFAKEMAQKSIDENRAIALRPMNAYERMLVHSELAKVEGVTTESVGEDFNRKVMIKPA